MPTRARHANGSLSLVLPHLAVSSSSLRDPRRTLRGQPQRRDGDAGRDADTRSAAPGHSVGIASDPLPRVCGDVVEEYIPGIGGTITGNPSSCRRNETGVPGGGGCTFFKTQEEYEAILRDRGLLGPAVTPEQGKGRGYLIPAPSGFLIPEPVGNPAVVAAMEDLKQEMVAQKLAIAQLKTDIQDFKGKLGAGDKADNATKTGSLARWAKAIVKWFFVANAVVLLFCIVVGMSV